jgi:S1-C subfamily serine protease
MSSPRLLGRAVLLVGLVWLLDLATALAQIPDLAIARLPTLAPPVKEVTPAVVNISVQGKIREDNPLYHDPFFREFFRFFRWRRKSLSKNSDNLACAPFRTGLQYSALKSVACARDKLRLALKFDGSNSGPERKLRRRDDLCAKNRRPNAGRISISSSVQISVAYWERED